MEPIPDNERFTIKNAAHAYMHEGCSQSMSGGITIITLVILLPLSFIINGIASIVAIETLDPKFAFNWLFITNIVMFGMCAISMIMWFFITIVGCCCKIKVVLIEN
jgi:hypothetical protein